MSKILNWQETGRERILPFASVVKGKVPGISFDMVQIESKDSVMIVPCTKTGVIMITEARPPYGSQFLAFPAGKVDDGETPELAARRELREETGMTTRSIRFLGGKRLFHHLCSEVVYVFLAEVDPQDRGECDLEDGELIKGLTKLDWKALKKAIFTTDVDGVSFTVALWAMEVLKK